MFCPVRYVLVVFFEACYLITNAQSFDYGVIIIYNSSAQTNYDPTIPEDGTFQWNSLGTWGGGIYGSEDLSQKFTTSLVLNYQQKGYKELAQVIFVPGGPVNYENLHNTFNYLCADLFLKYGIIKSSSFRVNINFGIEYSYLLDYNIESDFLPINNYYPVKEYQDRWEKHNASVIPSISLTFDQATTLEFGFNGSISPVLKTENLVVKDWIWTFRVNQSIPEIFKKKV